MAKAAAPPFAAPTTPPGTKHAREAVERALAEIENFRQANPEAANAITSQLRK